MRNYILSGLAAFALSASAFAGDTSLKDVDYPEDPAGSTIEVAIDPTKINTYYPDAEKKVEWETEISSDPKFFNSAAHPAIMFKSTSARTTGATSGTVSGDLTFLGVTKPVTLDVTYNGKTNVPWQGDNDILGFTAKTVFKRSDWGMKHLIQNGIGDEVTIKFSGNCVITHRLQRR